MQRYFADILTISRFVAAITLLFFSPFSTPFWFLYGWAGVSDMLDGPIARKTGNASRGGALLDSIADLVFVVVCFVKIILVINIPMWLWVWISFIALIKIVNLVRGFVRQHKIVMPHTIANKITGALLFLFPAAIQFVPLIIPAIIVSSVATFAAVQEGTDSLKFFS